MTAQDIEGWFTEADMVSYNFLTSMIHDGILAEIGVYKGRSIASIIPTCQKNNLSVIAIDSWGGNLYDLVVRTVIDHLYKMSFFVPTKRRFLYNIQRIYPDFKIRAIRTTSIKGSRLIKNELGDGSLSAVFIDAQHDYNLVRQDILAWLPLVKEGGWIGGHDFGIEWGGVRRAVWGIFGKDYKTMPDSIWYHRV